MAVSLLIAALALALLCSPAPASLLGAAISFDADSVRVPADGESTVMITVEALEATGQPVPDGTLVHFTTSLGEIVSPVPLLGGFAQTVLSPGFSAGTAQVSAMVGSTREVIEVEFLGVPGSAAAGSGVVEVTAEDLSYDPQTGTFVGVGMARLSYDLIEIEAEGIRYEVSGRAVYAQGDVILRIGPGELTCDALRYELQIQRGRLLRFGGDDPERLLVEGERLTTRPDPTEDAPLWKRPEEIDTRTWVKAQHALINPGKKIILDHASFYVDGTPVMSLRRHVIDPRYGSALFGNSLGYDSLGGVNLDLPYYLHASGSMVGSLHLMRNRTAVGGADLDPGWALALREEYFRGAGTEGSFVVSDITQPGRGLAWDHRQNLPGKASLTLGLTSASLEDDAPDLRSASASYFLPLPDGKLSVTTSASVFGASESTVVGAAYRLRSRSLTDGLIFTPSVQLRHSMVHSEEAQVYTDPTTGEIFEIAQSNRGASDSVAAGFGLDLAEQRLPHDLRLTAGLNSALAHDLAGGLSTALNGRVMVMRRFGLANVVRLGYAFDLGGYGREDSLFEVGRQRLTLNGRAAVEKCDLQFNLSQNLGSSRAFGSVLLARPLPFGTDALHHPLWSLELSHVFSHVEDYGFSSSRIAVRRLLGRYNIGLCYSPQGVGLANSRPWIGLGGYGYTYSGGGHFWVEFSSAGF